ncbi:MAG TPA: quinone oxidoreductase [Anaeromyxobacter sp.]|nr:quinone oxidoreductase [Anaeromyxobacter sp.]
MARAIRFHETGGPEVLRVEDVPVGDPGPGQARVRHTFSGVNFVDIYHRSGLYPLALPSGLGSEAAGRVEAIGAGVTHVAPGDRVVYLASNAPGSYAEARVIAADRLVKLPDAVDDETAAAVFLKGLTVHALVRRTYAVKAGDTVLWHAAAGGVGLLALQWLKALGATVIGTVGSDEKAALARQHGCDHVIVYTRENFTQRVRELTGGAGVPVVYDSVGKATFDGSLDCLRPLGLMVSFGNASGAVPPIAPVVLSQKGSLFLTRPTVVHYLAARGELEAAAAELFRMIEAGKLRARVGGRWPLERAGEAQEALAARRTSGSLLIQIQ